jgi:DNA-binding response OmpR family regulator
MSPPLPANSRFRNVSDRQIWGMNAAGSLFMGAALNILTVDDERSITESMRFIFAGAQYDVTGVETANDALAKIDADPERYDVVIIDHKMPRVTGVDLVYEIRKRPYAGKIMVLSAHLSADIRMAFEELDVDVMIEKPFDIKQLRVMLDQLAA